MQILSTIYFPFWIEWSLTISKNNTNPISNHIWVESKSLKITNTSYRIIQVFDMTKSVEDGSERRRVMVTEWKHTNPYLN